MGLFSKKENYTEQTIGIIVGVSAVEVNKMHLPIAEYEVNGKKYQVRVPYDIARKMEKQSDSKNKLVRANLNFGSNSINLQATKIQGCQVTILYNSDKPNKSKVIDYIDQNRGLQ